MIGFLDVHYHGAGATAACAVAAAWTDPSTVEERTVALAEVEPYQPGAFYQRELPCLLAVLAAVTAPLAIVVVDGYVELDGAGRPGLGAHLHDRLAAPAVVGVAKTAFRGSDFAAAVLRPGSARPLYVTARGIAVAEAAAHVAGMHGEHRVPTLLTRVDQLARGLVLPR